MGNGAEELRTNRLTGALCFFATVKCYCNLESLDLSVDAKSAELYKAMADIIAQSDVHSVSCPFGGLNIWRILVEEQIKRSQKFGLSPQEAFLLYGPYSGLNNTPEDYGVALKNTSKAS